jgi:hypothetical protein
VKKALPKEAPQPGKFRVSGEAAPVAAEGEAAAQAETPTAPGA